MRLAWNSSNKLTGDASELSLVLDWLTACTTRWIQETLDWFVNGGSEPSWVQLLEHLETIEVPRAGGPASEFGQLVGQIRELRVELAAQAESKTSETEWMYETSVSSSSGQDVPVAVHVQSTPHGGRWSSVTVAVTNASEQWVRFEPQTVAPCSSWTIVSGQDWILTVEPAPSGATAGSATAAAPGTAAAAGHGANIELERRELSKVKKSGRPAGELCLSSSSSYFEATSKNLEVSIEEGRLKSFDLSVDSNNRNGHMVVLDAKVKIRLRRRILELYQLFVPIMKLVARRKIKLGISQELNKLMASPGWKSVVELARSEKHR